MMITRSQFFLWGFFFAGLISAAGSLSAADSRPTVEEPKLPERLAYRVRLFVAFDPAGVDQTAIGSIVRDIEQTALRCVGDLWSLQVDTISWLQPVSGRGLERVELASLQQHHAEMKHDGEEAPDIWYVAAVESLPVGFRLSVRSWQPEVQAETQAVSFEVMDQRDIAVTLIKLCHDLARPMGIVEQVEDRTVRIRLRAGELSSPDPAFVQLKEGEVLVPMLAYRNKDKVIEKLQSIPWTYITVDQVEASTVRGTVQSGLKLALGGKKRGRIDTLVVALRPQYEATRLELFSQGKPPLPLVAHRLEIRTQSVIPRPTEENPDVDPSSTLLDEKLTNRLGMTVVPKEPDRPLVWLFAYSGQHLLARVPFVPGATASARLEVPDDGLRLATEADLQMLQGEVIDAVALRNTAIATIRAAAKKDDWATVNQKLELLKGQQNMKTLIDRLTAVRVAGVTAAKASRDKVAEARITRMCDEAVTLINTHLGNDKVRLLTEEMEALQGAQAESNEAPPK